MPLADAAAHGRSGVLHEGAQVRRVRLKGFEQVGGVAIPRQHQQMLHGEWIHDVDGAGGVTLEQSDGTGVEKGDKLVFAAAVRLHLSARSGRIGAPSLLSPGAACAPALGRIRRVRT